MALMHEEVYLALRSVMPEDRAIEGAARLYRAVSGHTDPTNEAQAGDDAGDGLMPRTSTLVRLATRGKALRAGDYPLWVDILLLKWMMAASIVMSMVIMLKLFSH